MVFDAGKTLGGSLGEMAGQGAGGMVQGRFGDIAGRSTMTALGAINQLVFGGGRLDPELSFQFYIEFSSLVTSVEFKECKGIEWEAQVESFREGGNNMHEQHLIGPASFKPLEIKRGFMGAHAEFYKWMFECVDPFSRNSVKRENFSLVVCSDNMIEVARFDFYNAFISKWQGPSFDAGANEIAFESMTLVYDFFDFTAGGAVANALKNKAGKLLNSARGFLT